MHTAEVLSLDTDRPFPLDELHRRLPSLLHQPVRPPALRHHCRFGLLVLQFLIVPFSAPFQRVSDLLREQYCCPMKNRSNRSVSE